MATTNHTDSALKKYFYSGIGFMAHSGDIVQKSMDEVSKRGKISEDDGRRIVNDAMQKWGDSYNEAVHKLGAWANGEISRLNTRIVKMEKQLAMKQSGSVRMARTPARSGSRTVSTKRNK